MIEMKVHEQQKEKNVEALEFLIIKQMTGRTNLLLALFDYISRGTRPVDLEQKYKIKKRLIRRYAEIVQNIVKNSIIAELLITKTVPLIVENVPVIVESVDKDVIKCRLCNKKLYAATEYHIIKRHKKEIEEYKNKIISLLKQEMQLNIKRNDNRS